MRLLFDNVLTNTSFHGQLACEPVVGSWLDVYAAVLVADCNEVRTYTVDLDSQLLL